MYKSTNFLKSPGIALSQKSGNLGVYCGYY